MKLETSTTERPVVSPPWRERSAFERPGHKQSSVITANDCSNDIASLTSKVSNKKLESENTKDKIHNNIADISKQLRNISLNTPVVVVGKQEEAYSKEDQKKQDVTGDIKEIELVKAVEQKDGDVPPVKDAKVATGIEECEDGSGDQGGGCLVSRGPMLSARFAGARAAPYNQTQVIYNHNCGGSYEAQVPDNGAAHLYSAPFSGTTTDYTRANIYGDEDSGISGSPLGGSGASSPSALLTDTPYLSSPENYENEANQTDLEDLVADFLDVFCQNTSIASALDELIKTIDDDAPSIVGDAPIVDNDTFIPTVVTDMENAPPRDKSSQSYDRHSTSSGYGSSRSTDTPSPVAEDPGNPMFDYSPFGDDHVYHQPVFHPSLSPGPYSGDFVLLNSPAQGTKYSWSDDTTNLTSPSHIVGSNQVLLAPLTPCTNSNFEDDRAYPTSPPQSVSPNGSDHNSTCRWVPGPYSDDPNYPSSASRSPEGTGVRAERRSAGPAQRQIVPKPQRSTSRPAKARMSERLDDAMKKSRWATVAAKKPDELTKGDEQGDTLLFILLLKTEAEVPGKLEWVYALVERLKLIPGALAAVNMQRQSALELSALFCPGEDRALVTRYIAESLADTGADLNELNSAGAGLLHILAAGGDAHCDVMAELIGVQAKGAAAFDVDKCNVAGLSPLQLAVMNHGVGAIRSTRTVRLLISAGANTATNTGHASLLHHAITASCDVHLVAALLTGASPAQLARSSGSYRETTLLHVAAARNDVAVEQQAAVCKMLMDAGWRRDARDLAGRCALDIVDKARREEFKKLTKI